MKTAIIIHGTPDQEEWDSREYPSCSNGHWLPWLQKELLLAGYDDVQTPEMPKAYWPNYFVWKQLLERFEINKDSILVGHSCGGGFLLRYLSEKQIKIKRLVLVAPWLDPLKNKDPSFFNFKLDPHLTNRMQVKILYSDNDMESIDLSLDIIRDNINNTTQFLFKGYGHFCTDDMGTVEFPELLNICLKGER